MQKLDDDTKTEEKYPEFDNFIEISKFLQRHQTIRSEFKIILLIASTDDQNEILAEFKENYDMSKMDFLYKIKKFDEEKKEDVFLGYLLFPLNSFENDLFKIDKDKIDNQISFLIIFTYSTSEQVKSHLFTHFVNKNSLINSLWITHQLTMDLIDQFVENASANITKLEGYYSPLFEEKPSQRPDFYRKISYEGGDAINSYYELKKLYGINVENFTGIIDYNEFNFKRERSILSFKRGSLIQFIQTGIWLFSKASEYLKEVRKFKKILYESIFLKRRYLLNNNLMVKFGQELSDTVLNEMIKAIQNSHEIEIIRKFSREDYFKYEDVEDHKKENFYRLKLVNNEKKGVFLVDITPNSAEISQIFKTNYIGVFPLLDILDYTHPQNEILILEN